MITAFEKEDDRNLAAYIAANNPGNEDRLGNKLYKRLVQNKNNKWPWAERHSWSAWLARYESKQESFDRRIKRYQDRHEIIRTPSPPPQSLSITPKRVRHPYTEREDGKLVVFLAKMAPLPQTGKRSKFGRSGNYIYQNILVANPNEFPWASAHTWHSWRERYVKNRPKFDRRIELWQKMHSIDPEARAKEAEEKYGKNKAHVRNVEVKGGEDQVDELDESQYGVLSEHGGKRCRDDNEEERAEDAHDHTRPWKKQKVSEAQYPNSVRGGSASDEPVELIHRRTTSMSRSIEDVMGDREHQEQDAVLHQLAVAGGFEGADLGLLESGEKDNNESRRTFQSEDAQPTTVSVCQKPTNQLPYSPDFPCQASSKFEASNLEWPPLEAPDAMADDTGPIYPPLPTPSPRLSKSPQDLPGGYPESSQRDAEATKTPRRAPPEPSSVTRSHHPTPPPTNVQSDASVQSLTLDVDPPRLSAKAKGKGRAGSPLITPVSMSSAYTPRSTHRDRSNGSTNFVNLPHPPANISPQKPFERRVKSRLAPRNPLFVSPSPSLSDGPFATSPPSPRRTEVIRGMPKPRPGRSFRDNDRIRDRNVVLGEVDSTCNPQEASDEEGEDGGDQDATIGPSLRGKGKSRASEPAMSFPFLNIPLANDALVMGKVTPTTTARHEQRVAIPNSRTLDRPHRPASTVETAVPKAPNNTPFPAAPLPSSSTITPGRTLGHNINADPSPADVFASQMPILSGSNHDPYVLNTFHFSEPSTTSTVSRVQRGSPAPRRRMPHDHDRRRTFAGFDHRLRLPDIDLVAESRKRSQSRSPVFTWTRGTSNIANKPGAPPSLPYPLLTASERSAALRGSSRKSVIPVIVDPENQKTVSLSLDNLSPSTSGLIFQVGLATIFKQMEENHGFSADVVRRAWVQQDMDLNATDNMLLRMRIAAENALYDEEDEASAPVVEKGAEKLHKPAQNALIQRHSTSMPEPDYTPPPRSRADHYLRLSEQGRIWEARQREIELAADASVNNSPTKDTPSKPAVAPVWKDDDDDALRKGDEAILVALAQKFGEDVILRKFLAIMRRGSS